ncbi:Opticin [Madurella mycetomatis]|uniref:Opticin n=1 Tax=Madurella mycetomatis TaxID=100816 RepID=A0A175VTF0_9PEZI|nr:Opticin [Madurella mycetomatis]
MSPCSLVFVLLGLLPLAVAFGTINEPMILGQHNEHEMVTRLAFQCSSGQRSDGICFEPRSLDQLAGYHRDVMGLPIPGAGFNGAVGSPDTLDPIPEGPEAHCDDADYLDIPGYPQTRAEATAKLQACVDHFRARFRQAWAAAAELLDERKRIRPGMVELANSFGDCTFAFPALQGNALGRAKCSTLEGFGRALHGIQDFYSHSNWADTADPSQPISESNPPGLAMNGTAPFLDMRATGPIPPDQIPLTLTTGCFALPDTSPGSGDCTGRITHHALSKDNGLIYLDGTFGEVGPDSPRSEAVPSNFHQAVKAAIQSSRDAWDSFRDEIRYRYGAVSGNLMICALIRDDPIKDCRNRTAVVAVDVSWRSSLNGASELEVSMARELNSRLTPHGLDKVALVEFDKSARLVYPMGYPQSATFGFSEPCGSEANLGSALRLAIGETIEAQPETFTDRGAILLLSTASEGGGLLSENALAQVRRAAEEGIRVHHGCISTPKLTSEHFANGKGSAECQPNNQLLRGVLETGGVFAWIKSREPRTAANFISLVMDRGLTATDDDDTQKHTWIFSGIITADFLSPDFPVKSFVYPVSSGEHLNFTIGNIASEDQETQSCFTMTLWIKGLQIKIATHIICSGTDPLSLAYEATVSFDLVLVAQYGHGTTKKAGPVNVGDVVFTLGLDTNMPEKNETITRSSISIVSSGTTREAQDSATHGALTSETPDIPFSTEIVGRSTWSSSHCSKARNDSDSVFRLAPYHELMCSARTITATTMASNFTEN